MILELGIDTSCLLVPEPFSQLLQTVIGGQTFCHKDFKIGALQQVCSENYAFSIIQTNTQRSRPLYKAKITDTKTIDCGRDIAFPFLNKGRIINNVRSNRTFYLWKKDGWMFSKFNIGVYRFKTMNYLKNNETLSRDDNIYQHVNTTSIHLGEVYKQEDADVPVMVSISYVSYTSTLQFFVKLAGVDTSDKHLVNVIETGEPLTLSRF